MRRAGTVRLRRPSAWPRHWPALGGIAASLLIGGCGEQVERVYAQHVAVLTEDRVAPPFTLLAVDRELHVVFASREALALQVAVVEPHTGVYDVETIDTVDVYPGEASAFGSHAYALSAGRIHVVYVDRQTVDASIPKRAQRDRDSEIWWIDSPAFVGAPRAIVAGPESSPVLAAATGDSLRVTALANASKDGRHDIAGLPNHFLPAWPVTCGDFNGFVAVDDEGELRLHPATGGRASTIASGVGANYAACSDGRLRVLWHTPATGDVLFAGLDGPGLGPVTGVTLAGGTTSLFFYGQSDAPSYVLDETLSGASGVVHRLALLRPDTLSSSAGRTPETGYRKAILLEAADQFMFAAARVGDLLVIVERRDGLRAHTFHLP